jgi:hypothetical protein
MKGRMEPVGYQGLALDAGQVAASFGSVVGPGAEMPVADFSDGVMSIRTETVAGGFGAPQTTQFSFLGMVAKVHELQPENEAQTKTKQRLIDKLSPLLLACEDLAAEITETRDARLDARGEELRHECDLQDQVLRNLEAEERAANVDLLTIIGERDYTQRILQDLSELKRKGQHVRRWAPQSEIDKWEAGRAEVQKKAREILERMSQATQRISLVAEDLRQAAAKMNQLKNAEARVRKEKSGGQGYDLEFGLSMKPVGWLKAD